jgi:glycine/D-amino acid oxidase-like deaminating enzyme
LTTARLLAATGTSVAVAEAGRVASGVTGYTTAKITSLHRLIYRELIDRHGESRAAAYADANRAAIARIADLVETDGFERELEKMDAFTYTDDEGGVAAVEAEVEAALRLGLPARFETTTDLPFPIKAAVRFTGQAQFHPRRYCLGLAAGITAAGGLVHEHTRAVGVDEADGRCVVRTERARITAGHVVVATHLPFLDAGGLFARPRGGTPPGASRNP